MSSYLPTTTLKATTKTLARRGITSAPNRLLPSALSATFKPRYKEAFYAFKPTSFLDTLNAKLPFTLPAHSWIHKGIGNTPMTQIDEGIWAKLEGHSPGGSLKDRTLGAIVLGMFERGEIALKGDTLVLVTSGSAGMSLITLHKGLSEVKGLELNVVVVMPKAYASKEVPAEICALSNTRVLHGPDALIEDMATVQNAPYSRVALMDGAFIDVLADTKKIAAAKGWKMVDQHFDQTAMDGHRSTAQEIMQQCPDITDVVCATGTGATAAGLMKHLPSYVKVHSRPAVSGSIDGLSNVARYNNFCDSTKLEGYDKGVFEMDDAVKAAGLMKEHPLGSLEGGLSMGATYWLAKDIVKNDPKRKVVFICADGKIKKDPPKRKKPFKPVRITCPVPAKDVSGGRPQPMYASARGFRSHAPIRSFKSLINGSSPGRRHMSTGRRTMSTASAPVVEHDAIIIGGGPVGASTAWFLSESEKAGKSILCVHDPANKGAHEDWSRLARLSFDGPLDEMVLSRHAVSLLDMADEVRSYQSGAPVVPLRPGMLFLASPGTNMAKACAHGEANYGDPDFVRRDVSEIAELYPGNPVNLPPDTLCWTHPVGLCVSPLELAQVARGVAQSYGVQFEEGQASIDLAPEEFGPNMLRVTLTNGQVYHTRNCYLMAGAQSKKIIADAIERSPRNDELRIPEFDDTYITAISTVRYKHRHHPSAPAEGSGHVVTPITLGQLEIPDLIGFQANFSVVAEEYGDVLKTRLSGAAGNETIETVADMHTMSKEGDAEMAKTYGRFFGTLFPYLETEQPLDFNRCVTYRNFDHRFSGTSLVEKTIGADSEGPTSRLMSTAGCFGVGVKFGPALGQAAAAHTYGEELEEGMNVIASGSPKPVDDGAERIERAW